MSRTKAVRCTLSQVRTLSVQRRLFNANDTLHSEFTQWPSRGRLNEEETALLNEAAKNARDNHIMLYVVYSYATPIAWGTAKEPLYKVKQKFSVTTSKHWGCIS